MPKMNEKIITKKILKEFLPLIIKYCNNLYEIQCDFEVFAQKNWVKKVLPKVLAQM